MKKAKRKQDRAEGPKKAWSGRFREATAPEVEKFTESVSFDQRLYRQDILGSIAHARMLGQQGILAAGEAERIEKRLSILEEAAWAIVAAARRQRALVQLAPTNSALPIRLLGRLVPLLP